MRVVVSRVISHTSTMVVQADTIGEAVRQAEGANETEWSTPKREQRIFPVIATGAPQ